MKILKCIFSITSISVLFSSCESPLTNIPLSRLPQTESKLVVHSVIAPQLKYIVVTVGETVPLYTENDASDEPLENAVVKLSNGVSEVKIPYDPKNRVFILPQSKFPIMESKTYSLTVSEGGRIVTAKCTVPGKKPIFKSYKMDTIVMQNGDTRDTSLTLHMSWQDIPADTNHYRINAEIDFEYSIGIEKDKPGKPDERVTNHFKFAFDWQQGKTDFVSDNHMDGMTMHAPIGKVLLPSPLVYIAEGGNTLKIYPKTKIKAYLLEVLNLDENYYKYERSVSNKDNADSPFSEPMSIYTNIEGGLGCFSAYNATQLKVSFTK